jgi:hypothetical protein
MGNAKQDSPPANAQDKAMIKRSWVVSLLREWPQPIHGVNRVIEAIEAHAPAPVTAPAQDATATKLTIAPGPTAAELIEAWKKQQSCKNCQGTGEAVYFPGGTRPCHVCNPPAQSPATAPAGQLPGDEEVEAYINGFPLITRRVRAGTIRDCIAWLRTRTPQPTTAPASQPAASDRGMPTVTLRYAVGDEVLTLSSSPEVAELYACINFAGVDLPDRVRTLLKTFLPGRRWELVGPGHIQTEHGARYQINDYVVFLNKMAAGESYELPRVIGTET